MENYEILLVVDRVNEREVFEKHLKKEGFLPIENEELAYKGEANLPIMNTRAYIFDVLKKALKLSNTKTCTFICQLGGNPLEKYAFSKDDKNFKEIKG